MERRLFLEGAVAASGGVCLDEGVFPVHSSPNTRWAAIEGAPAGFVAHDPLWGLYRVREE